MIAQHPPSPNGRHLAIFPIGKEGAHDPIARFEINRIGAARLDDPDTIGKRDPSRHYRDGTGCNEIIMEIERTGLQSHYDLIANRSAKFASLHSQRSNGPVLSDFKLNHRYSLQYGGCAPFGTCVLSHILLTPNSLSGMIIPENEKLSVGCYRSDSGVPWEEEWRDIWNAFFQDWPHGFQTQEKPMQL